MTMERISINGDEYPYSHQLKKIDASSLADDKEFDELIDYINTSGEAVLIMGENNDNLVMLSKERYESLAKSAGLPY